MNNQLRKEFEEWFRKVEDELEKDLKKWEEDTLAKILEEVKKQPMIIKNRAPKRKLLKLIIEKIRPKV
jgi:hypothetical protein